MTDFEKKFFGYEAIYEELFEHGKVDEAWEKLFDTAKIFDDSKESESMYYWYLDDILKYSIETNRFDIGDKYIDIFMKTDLARADKGVREFRAGVFYYEKGEKELAAKYLRVTYGISTARWCFNGKDNKKYKDFIKECIDNEKKANTKICNNETLVENFEKNFPRIQELCQSGDDAFDDDDLESALDDYLEAWELIPQPKGGYEATGWVAAAIGEVLFEQKKYKEALDYFQEAYYAIGGQLNPYVNLMLGKCFYLLKKKKEAASYLHMAYELDGDAIFEDEDPVFIQLAKK